MIDTWFSIMADLDYRHDRLVREVYFGQFAMPSLTTLPWIVKHPVPRDLDPCWWWNNVSLASTTQDGV